ncbi:MAG: DUF433 domain-containing protein [Hormoscilla sp. SP5CHS1]|nr:DUF433 domain-containing protein [Hormoscilla sp. SP12CHS1]MBC6453454.1 DUF433 domain-containing protein [Hormoscilla sp. SP5CHS1]
MSKIATAVFDGEVLRPDVPLELEPGKSYAIGDDTERVSKEHIVIHPDYCFGKPRIINTRMYVAAIAEKYLEIGESLEEIAAKYDLSLASVHAAMAYYYDYREEIDRRTAESEALVEEMRRNSPPSRFQEKLRAIRGD